MRTDRFACLAAAAAIMLALLFVRADPPMPAHVCLFALIAALLWHGTAGAVPLAVLGAVVAFAALEQVYQVFVPGRTAELADFIADAAAAAVVIGLLWARKESTSRKEKPCVELSRPLPAATSSRS